MKTPPPNRMGMIITIISLLALSQLLYLSYDMRQTADCQTQVNQIFLETLKQRSQIADGDREAIRTLVTDLVDDKISSEQAIQDYYERDRQLQALRDTFTFPQLGEC